MTSTETSGSGDLSRTLDLLWDAGPRPSRGPKPALTLDRIVEAAIEVADAEGLEAVTMRRVATQLGTGAMSLYRYVPGKAELLDVMLDRVQRPAAAELGGEGWRGALEAMAYENLAQFQRHTWLLQVNQARPVVGPGVVEGMERVLSRIRPMGLADRQLVSVVVMIDAYVSGAARNVVYSQEAEGKTGLTDQQFWAVQVPYLERAMSGGHFPVMKSLDEDAFDPGFDDFDFGLQRILDGLELHLTRREKR
ncbi:TetR/AcrR family transcriptional regulator [Nocardia altamirensis]|uniref:TetR/AcrR family transcriptional regulator n=1 Tax=Nocardia altamirensis TaxID=472158 RepID=UPI0008401E0B|nr:TetR/AcrR family transcriptional regulator [Nocardia altamirensis]